MGKSASRRPRTAGIRPTLIIGLAALFGGGLIYALTPLPSVRAAREALTSGWNPVAVAARIASIAPVLAPKVFANTGAGAVSSTLNMAGPAATTPISDAAAFAGAPPYQAIDAAIQKTSTPEAVFAGDQVLFTLTIVNNGGATILAGDATVTDPVPANTTIVAGMLTATSNFTGCTEALLTGAGCTNSADLAPGNIGTITFKVTVSPAFAGPFVTNEATVTVDGDVNTTNNISGVSVAVGPHADLVLNKSASQPTVVAGGASESDLDLPEDVGNITYILLISNAGPSNAINVALEDVVPNNTIMVSNPTLISSSVTINGVPQPGFLMTCNIFPSEGNLIQCLPGNNTGINPAFTNRVLPAGFMGRVSFRVRVPANAVPGQIVTNEARVVSRTFFDSTDTTPDPNSANNTQVPTQTLITTSSDLEITKQTSNENPVAGGGAFSYTLTVSNNGPSNAKNAVVSDPLPQGIILANNNITILPANSGFSCATPGLGENGTIICSNADMPPGTVIFTIIAQAFAGQAGGVRTNTATVSSSTQDTNSGNNSSSAMQNIQVNAPLSISKTGPATVCAGDTFTYEITVNNGGQSTAINATISDPLPANTTFVSQSGTGAFANACTHNGAVPGTVTCPTIDIPSGMHRLNITVRLAGSAPTGTLPNTASITNAGTGSIAVGTSTANTQVNHCADLSLTKIAPGALGAGTTIDYVLTIRNNGPSDITGGAAPGVITVMDTLPAEAATFVSALAGVGEPGGFTCTADPGPPIKVTCVNAAGAAGDFPVGAVANITIKVVITPSAVPGTNIPNCGMISAPTTTSTPQIDPNASNNTSCASSVVSEILTVADLGVSKSATAVVDPDGAGPLVPVPLPVVGPNVPPGSVNAGGYIRYELQFGNAGPADAVNVRLTDVVPASTAFVGALATGGVFVPSVQPPAVPFIFTILATDTVAPLGPNISLTCTVSGAAGSQQIQCTPQGNTGLMPPYADGTLPNGYRGTLVFFVKVNESVQGGAIISNPANITSAASGETPSTPDPNTGNNTSSSVSTIVVVTANLAITKIVQSAVTVNSNGNQVGPVGPATPENGSATTGVPVVPGTFLTYRLTVTNNGPSDVSNLRVTDFIPSALETPPGRILGARFVSATPVIPSGAVFTCGQATNIPPVNNPQSNGGTVMCTAPSLSAVAPNNTAAIDILVFIDPATTLSLVNTATVDATLNNFNQPTSGTAVLTTPVPPRAGPTSDQIGASILVFPIYASDSAMPHRENTRMSITNTAVRDSACVHMFNMDGATCSVADLFVCLSPNQTVTMLASDLDPGNQGYSIAVAVDCKTGLPTGSNTLIGEEFVKFQSGHAANLQAWGIRAVQQSPAGVDPNVESVVLRFDGLAYNRLPRILLVDGIGSRADNDSMLVVLDRIGGDMFEGGIPIGNLFGWLYNDMEIGYSFTARYTTCQLKETISNTFPRTTPALTTVIPQGHTGWMKIWSTTDGALIGAQINLNTDANLSARAFNQGRNLHILTLTSSATLTIPVVIPFC